jgi:hypothetical protein
MEEKLDTYAYFWVEGFECNPQEISDTLGLAANEAYSKGDLISEHSDRRRKRSSWKYISSLPREEPYIDSHIQNLVDVLITKKAEIEKLKTIYDIGINCVGYYTNVNPGFHMSKELIKSCAELDISIDFDLYTY